MVKQSGWLLSLLLAGLCSALAGIVFTFYALNGKNMEMDAPASIQSLAASWSEGSGSHRTLATGNLGMGARGHGFHRLPHIAHISITQEKIKTCTLWTCRCWMSAHPY